MGEPQIHVQVTEVRVSLVPWSEDDPESMLWDVTLSWRGGDRWAVCLHGHRCLGADGEWDWEPSPSNRTDKWVSAHRFDYKTALRLAAEKAPEVTVNGFTPLDHLRRLTRDTEGDDA